MRNQFACSCCGSRDWPRRDTGCPLCSETEEEKTEDRRQEEDEPVSRPVAKALNVYAVRAAQDFRRGIVSMAGSGVLVVMCVWAAFAQSAGWAVVCGCASVFCWFGAKVYFHDAAINRQKAKWRHRPEPAARRY